jgi:putative modified peptide
MAGPKTAPLEPKIVDRLLDLLGDSDKFRELFQQSPATALELIGHVDPGVVAKDPAAASLTSRSTESVSIAGCLNVSELASKEMIRAARDDLRSMLLSGLSHTTPQLDAGLSDSSRTLK